MDSGAKGVTMQKTSAYFWKRIELLPQLWGTIYFSIDEYYCQCCTIRILSEDVRRILLTEEQSAIHSFLIQALKDLSFDHVLSIPIPMSLVREYAPVLIYHHKMNRVPKWWGIIEYELQTKWTTESIFHLRFSEHGVMVYNNEREQFLSLHLFGGQMPFDWPEEEWIGMIHCRNEQGYTYFVREK